MTELLHRWRGPGYVRRVDVPANFRVGLPETIVELLGEWLSADGATLEDSGLGGHWVRVEGEPLPVPVLVRIDRADDGRFLVTGLLIGHHDRREITWETMRQIKPATLLGLIFSGFDPNDPLQRYLETDPGSMQTRKISGDVDEEELQAWLDNDDDLPLVRIGSPEWREHIRALAALRIWEVTQEEPKLEVTPVNRPRASVARDLRAFADTYMRHYAANPRRATTATARELHISRATAIRRIAECREIGLIPPKEKS